MRPAVITLCVLLGSLHASADAIGQGAPIPQATSPTEKLKEARDLFRARDFDKAYDKLTGLLYPKLQLALPSDLVEAHLLLGVCMVETGRPGEAKDEFKEVLRLEPGKLLDSALFSRNAIRIFDETKSEVEDERRRLEEQRHIEEMSRAQQEYLKSLRPIEIHQYWMNFVPFGAGQFQDHRIARGLAFATGQGVTLALSGGVWLYLVGKYGIVSDRVAPQDVNTVRDLQAIEIVSGGAFFVLYGLGVVDSLLHYKSRVQVQGDESLLPPELRKAKKKTSLRDRIHVFPMPNAHGAGIGLGWED
jgi:hypothetical protein